MNIETIEIPLEEYRMLLKEAKTNVKNKLIKDIERLEGLTFEDTLVRLSKINEYKRDYELISDKLRDHSPVFNSEDIPF